MIYGNKLKKRTKCYDVDINQIHFISHENFFRRTIQNSGSSDI